MVPEKQFVYTLYTCIFKNLQNKKPQFRLASGLLGQISRVTCAGRGQQVAAESLDGGGCVGGRWAGAALLDDQVILPTTKTFFFRRGAKLEKKKKEKFRQPGLGRILTRPRPRGRGAKLEEKKKFRQPGFGRILTSPRPSSRPSLSQIQKGKGEFGL